MAARSESRLARAISKLGYCSRSRAAELIAAGRVKWNGAVRRDPETPVHIGKDRIEIDGQPVASSSKIYLAMNKRRGVVTTASDEKERETVYTFLPQNLPWLAPVGRLDKASEGLLLLTNDSQWAARITAPETHLDKTYHVQINAIADGTLLQQLRNGIRASDDDFLCVKMSACFAAVNEIRGSRLFWTKARIATSAHARCTENRSAAARARRDRAAGSRRSAKGRNSGTQTGGEAGAGSRDAKTNSRGCFSRSLMEGTSPRPRRSYWRPLT